MQSNRHSQTSAGEEVGPAIHRFSFSKGFPQPELESYTFTCGKMGENGFEINLAHGVPRVSLTFDREVRFFSPRSSVLPPTSLIRANLGYITHLIDIVRFDRTPADDSSKPTDEFDFASKAAEIVKIHNTYRNSAAELQQNVFASAPVRTEPRRTYNPSEIVSSSEGSHVPLELARMKLRSPDSWKSIKKNLVEFGEASGL